MRGPGADFIPGECLRANHDRLGEADLVTPLEHAAAFSSRIRGSRIAIVEEAGHFPQKEKPQTFLRVVCNFLAGRDEPVAGTR
jgi:hypothetical protein